MGEKKGIGEVVQDICETNEYRLPRYEPGECATKRRSVTRAVTESVREVENENFPRIYETRVSSSPQRTFLFTFCSLQIHLQLPLLQKIQGEDPSNPYSRSEA